MQKPREAFGYSPEEVLKYFGTNPETGLTEEQVNKNGEKFGWNRFPPPPKQSIIGLILDQFKDRMVIVLLFAVVLGFIFAFLEDDPEERTTAFIEPWVIIIILALNAVISVLQELQAESSVEALKEYQPNNANVLRGGEIQLLQAEDVVCGDIVEVHEGQQVPADCRIYTIGSTVLKIDQASLTGESQAVTKDTDTVNKPTAVLAEKSNCAFSGTPIVRGRFRGIVYAVGTHSEIGKVQKGVQETEDTITPLQKSLDSFGDVISKGILVICIITWAVNIPKFEEAGHGVWWKGALSFFKIAVSLAVAAIPEGLPAVVTTTLSLGVNRMAKEKAIVTVLTAVETLGCTSVICSDKTGTLTTNQMTVKAFLTVSGDEANEFEVEGNNYNPTVGFIKAAGTRLKDLHTRKAFQKAAQIATLCNDSRIIYNTEKKEFQRNGEPTEAAFKVLAEKIGLPDANANTLRIKKQPIDKFEDVSKYWNETTPKVRTHEFTRDRKAMSVIVGDHELVYKGAFEVVLGNCSKYLDDISGEIKDITPEVYAKIDAIRARWAGGSNCYRCLGVAYKDVPDYQSWNLDSAEIKKKEVDCIWAGAVGIIDPARDTVPPSIRECHSAGIRVIMCTGDNPETATAIARKIGMIGEHSDITGKVFTGNDWNAMDRKAKEEAARTACVLARVEPIHKQELVEILQEQKHVVAMTGDGVNDAPALKKAQIGVAMGSGTKVAQNAAKMILSDDSFTTIVKAVAEGRAIYNNTTAFIRYLITCNIGEVVSCFVSSIIGGPNLLRSTQLLFVNLVTDGLPATALGVNPAEPGVMDMPPRKSDESIVNGFTLVRYLVGGIYLGFATIAAAYYWYIWDPEGPHLTWYDVTHWMTSPPGIREFFDDPMPSTMAMSVLVIVEMFSAMTAISERQSILKMGPWENKYLMMAIIGSFLIHLLCLEVPFLQKIFSVCHLDLFHWMIIVILGFPTLIIEELFKVYIRSHTEHVDPAAYE